MATASHHFGLENTGDDSSSANSNGNPNNPSLQFGSDQQSLLSSLSPNWGSNSETSGSSASKSPNLHINIGGNHQLLSSSYGSGTSGGSSGVESPGSFTAGSDSPASSVQSPPTPLPHTPIFRSHEAKEHDLSKRELPQTLIEAGWRKCYSKREQKFYFFNKLTQQSTWELPDLGRSKKRSSSELDTHSGSHGKHPFKKFIPSSDWDLSIHSNVRMPERVPFTVYPPHPEIEGKRVEACQKLRLQLQELCHGKDVQDLSIDTFNRWLIERKCDDNGRDPLISSECDIDISPSLLRDLLNCVPIRQTKVSTVAEVRRQLSRYAEGARRLAESSRHVTPDQRKQIKWHGEAMFDWLRKTQNPTKFEEYLGRLKFLRQKCQDILNEAARPGMEQICSKMNQNARETALGLQEEHRKMLVSCGIDVTEHELPPPRLNKIGPCYSAQLRFGTPRQPLVTQEQTPDGWVKLRMKQETLKLNATHFFKLEQLYRYNCFDDKKFDLFLPRVWSLLKRYQCLYGPNNQEGLNLQQSLPVKVFDILTKEFGTTFEGFASPLNCYYRQYCSMFPDSDGYFGSRGSFLDFQPTEGSFVLNPPFSQELIAASCEHVISLLRSSENASGNFPLSFVIFVPDWKNPPLGGLDTLEYSGFCRMKKELAAPTHYYRHGGQHWIQNKRDLLIRSSEGTVILLLQNGAGMRKWSVTEEKMEKLIQAFRNPAGMGE